MNNSATIHAEANSRVDEEEIPRFAMTKPITQHYMLTCDLEEKIRLFELAGIAVSEKVYQAIEEFQIMLASKLRHLMPHIEVRFIRTSEMARQIISIAQSDQHRSIIEGSFIVSTCSEIANPIHGYMLEVNRIIDYNGNPLGIGPRPGFPSLSEQIRALVAASAQRPIILMEDGAFTGDSLVSIIQRIHQAGGLVRGVITGFTFPKAEAKIIKALGKNGRLITTESVDHLVDWMPDHDFIPFMPNCGKVVGFGVKDPQASKPEDPYTDAYPFYSHDGYSRSAPYLLPFCPMADWTGINTHDLEEFKWFVNFCFEQAANIFLTLEEANEGEITISDLKKIRPLVSVPYVLGSDLFAGAASSRIVMLLGDIKQKIWE
ncbi:MAG: hypothetical protein AAB645_00715 [Patescibacteria group bacterium]